MSVLALECSLFQLRRSVATNGLAIGADAIGLLVLARWLVGSATAAARVNDLLLLLCLSHDGKLSHPSVQKVDKKEEKN